MFDAMPPKTRIALAGAGSAALLLGALLFQYLGYAPCQVCIWQRWPHGLAIAIAAICLIKPNIWLARLAGLIILAGAAIALYHVGVEQTNCSKHRWCAAMKSPGLSLASAWLAGTVSPRLALPRCGLRAFAQTNRASKGKMIR